MGGAGWRDGLRGGRLGRAGHQQAGGAATSSTAARVAPVHVVVPGADHELPVPPGATWSAGGDRRAGRPRSGPGAGWRRAPHGRIVQGRVPGRNRRISGEVGRRPSRVPPATRVDLPLLPPFHLVRGRQRVSGGPGGEDPARQPGRERDRGPSPIDPTSVWTISTATVSLATISPKPSPDWVNSRSSGRAAAAYASTRVFTVEAMWSARCGCPRRTAPGAGATGRCGAAPTPRTPG